MAAISLDEINAQVVKLEAQMKALKLQADEVRNKERAGVIDEMMMKIAEYGLTASDLKLGGRPGPAKKSSSTKSAAKAPAKYRGPNGEEWSGGRGRKPGWVTAALAEGKSISDFEIK